MTRSIAPAKDTCVKTNLLKTIIKKAACSTKAAEATRITHGRRKRERLDVSVKVCRARSVLSVTGARERKRPRAKGVSKLWGDLACRKLSFPEHVWTLFLATARAKRTW